MNKQAVVILTVEPWRANLYRKYAARFSIETEMGDLAGFLAHQRILRAKGDTAAVSGLNTPIRLALVGIATIDASDTRTLKRVVRLLARHRAVWKDHSMTAVVLDAAVAANASRLGLDPAEQQRLRRALRGEK